MKRIRIINFHREVQELRKESAVLLLLHLRMLLLKINLAL